jgi:hypothetical protein
LFLVSKKKMKIATAIATTAKTKKNRYTLQDRKFAV